MADARHVALVGLPGTGKSSVGARLAQRRQLPFVDLDAQIAAAAGTSIPEIFATQGESAFRALELAALQQTLDGPVSVVATGGGIVTTADARQLLTQRCTVVWLQAPRERLLDRLRTSREVRPLLADDPEGALSALAAQRGAWYDEVADFRVDTARTGVAGVAAEVDRLLSGVSA